MKEEYRANQTMISSTNFTSNVSGTLALTHFDKVGLMFSWASLTGTLTTTGFDIDYSNDGSNWATATTSVSVGTNATGTDAVSLTDANYTYVRVTANVGSVTDGTIKVVATLKR
jgi:hypothetical protein